MQLKSLQTKRALRTTLLVLLLSMMGTGKGYAQQDVTRDVIIGDLMYRLNSSSKTAIVLGHKDGTSATGELVIPHSVGHYGNSYSVTGIAENAFRGCSGLTGNLNLPGLKSIGNGAFEGCSGFTGNLVIPPVVAVGNRAFSGCSGFSSVSLPSYLHSGELNFDIGEYAFSNCTGLDSISFPYVGRFHISIGNHAFSGCNGLSTLNFPDYNNFQIIIGDYAFSECNGLSSSICFTYCVHQIGNNAFSCCTGITAISFTSTQSIILGNNAFSDCTGLTSVSFPERNNGIQIGDYAFSGCTRLTYISFSEYWVSIGDYAFSGCIGLVSINFDNVYLSRIGKNAFINTGWYNLQPDGILYMDEYCLGYKGAKPSGNVSIMENTKIICHGAFEDCSSITFVHFPNSVYYLQIGNNAFSGCTGITSVSIPDTGVSIGDEAFSGCTGLTTINFFKNTIIGNHAFSGCTGLTTVTLSSSIGKYAFSGCTGLASINFSNPNYPYGGISIGECAFSGCIGISSVTIPDYIASIGDYVFQNCSGLKEINFKANCTMDASNVWYGCSDISLNIDSVTIIERSYWNNCDALSSISIGNTVTTINEGAFASCHNLTTLIIGKSVKSIGKEAFAYNPRLNMVYYNVEKDLEAPAPYSANDNGNTAFYNCPNLTTIHIGADVQEIGSNIFKGCNTVHFVVALGPTPAVLDAGAFSDIVDNSVLMVSCGKRVAYYSVWNMFPFNNIIEDCNEYLISIGVNGTGGNVTSSATNAQMGQTITLTITPNPGMMLSSISVVNANDPTQIIPITPTGKAASNYSFVMPPFEVVVMATFKPSGTSVVENSSIEVSVYPNPTSGHVKIEAEDLKRISINNMLGQQIYNGKATGNEFEYDFGKHGKGLYLIRIETTSGVAVKKVSVR